jgi:hypothetical protein
VGESLCDIKVDIIDKFFQVAIYGDVAPTALYFLLAWYLRLLALRIR